MQSFRGLSLYRSGRHGQTPDARRTNHDVQQCQGFPDTRVLIGIIASRDRVGKILHHDPKTSRAFVEGFCSKIQLSR